MDSNITFRIDSDVKEQMAEICKQLGMSTSTAFNLFANAFVREKGMPFPVSLSKKERYLETVALKHSLTLPEARLMLYLRQIAGEITRKELADFVQLSRSSCWMLLQKLESKGWLTVASETGPVGKGSPKPLRIVFSSQADPLLRDLDEVMLEYRLAMRSGLSQQEAETYDAVNEKIQKQIRQML